MSVEKVNLAEKFESFEDHWHPRIVGRLNGQEVKIARLKGEFVMHKHDDEDEMFLVISGRLKMELEDKVLQLEEGEFVIIPKGVLHRPVADEEVKVMLFEPEGTVNTGNTDGNLTRKTIEEI